ncbi:hypothetical protein K227x_17070 [Rubripirellula lacrimiformis]|uniref:Uncharacterized protein n=1 Tax=Rubripirellula lacrimiformis TaxID=1930273 RepID=A0A517N856_9BACT|nr:hypothetical protein [Rubripirellula lacrimiformis]QDT03325.1 hypothetical protein K227x_17070 [Rubripirellula lacrimiformis]
MKATKHLLPVLISLVAVGTVASLAATKAPTSVSPLDGKYVVVSQPSVVHRVHGNGRFESVGQTDFVVVPMQRTSNANSCDYWIPLKDVSLLEVFNSKEDAGDFVGDRDQ